MFDSTDSTRFSTNITKEIQGLITRNLKSCMLLQLENSSVIESVRDMKWKWTAWKLDFPAIREGKENYKFGSQNYTYYVSTTQTGKSRNSVLEAERGLRGCSHRSSKILKIMFANFLNIKVNDLRGLSATVKQKVLWRPNVASEAVQIEIQKGSLQFFPTLIISKRLTLEASLQLGSRKYFGGWMWPLRPSTLKYKKVAFTYSQLFHLSEWYSRPLCSWKAESILEAKYDLGGRPHLITWRSTTC